MKLKISENPERVRQVVDVIRSASRGSKVVVLFATVLILRWLAKWKD